MVVSDSRCTLMTLGILRWYKGGAYALASTESSMMWIARSGTSISPSKSEAMKLNAAIASARLFLSR